MKFPDPNTFEEFDPTKSHITRVIAIVIFSEATGKSLKYSMASYDNNFKESAISPFDLGRMIKKFYDEYILPRREP